LDLLLGNLSGNLLDHLLFFSKKIIHILPFPYCYVFANRKATDYQLSALSLTKFLSENPRLPDSFQQSAVSI
ncbi:MAG: hypothetical protein WA974_06560, partial [Thermodesulfobacteriota bacterium]